MPESTWSHCGYCGVALPRDTAGCHAVSYLAPCSDGRAIRRTLILCAPCGRRLHWGRWLVRAGHLSEWDRAIPALREH